MFQNAFMEKDTQAAAISADRDALRRQVSTMQNHLWGLLEHLHEVTACVQRQRDGQGNPVDVAGLLSQTFTCRQQAMDQERAYQYEIAKLRKFGSVKDAKIQALHDELQKSENKRVLG